MKFLNYDRVLCLSPHPDDVEYGMLGTIMKCKDTKFDVVVLSYGGDFDKSTSIKRQLECEKVWEHIDNISGCFIEDSKFIKDKDEDEWVNLLENQFNISDYDCVLSPSINDSHFEHKIVGNLPDALVRRSRCGITHYRSPSTLDSWTPNFFVNLNYLVDRKVEDGHSRETQKLFSAVVWYLKLNKLKLFKSQQDKSYFKDESIKSFHSEYHCTSRGLNNVESFKIIRGYN